MRYDFPAVLLLLLPAALVLVDVLVVLEVVLEVVNVDSPPSPPSLKPE